MALALEVYRLTSGFPKSELFGISSQIRRSAGSVPANISEGAGRGTSKEFIRFLRIASGSLSELDTHIDLAFGLNYLDRSEYDELGVKMKKISAKIYGLIRSVKQKQKSNPN